MFPHLGRINAVDPCQSRPFVAILVRVWWISFTEILVEGGGRFEAPFLMCFYGRPADRGLVSHSAAAIFLFSRRHPA